MRGTLARRRGELSVRARHETERYELGEERPHVVRRDLAESLLGYAGRDLLDAALTVDVREGQEQELRELHELAIALDEVLVTFESAVFHLSGEMEVGGGLRRIGNARLLLHLLMAGPVGARHRGLLFNSGSQNGSRYMLWSIGAY